MIVMGRCNGDWGGVTFVRKCDIFQKVIKSIRNVC